MRYMIIILILLTGCTTQPVVIRPALPDEVIVPKFGGAHAIQLCRWGYKTIRVQDGMRKDSRTSRLHRTTDMDCDELLTILALSRLNDTP